MSLTQEAIQLIIDNAVLAQGHTPDTNTPVAVLPASARVVVMEQFQAGRARFRGTLHTHSLRDFADYTLNRESNDARGFVDQDGMSCCVFFNLGDETNPGHADDTATLTLKPTAAYNALQAIVGKRLTQKALAEWMEDWRTQLNVTDDAGQHMAIAKAIAAVRDITIKASSDRTHTESNFGAARSSMDAIEAASKEAMPASIDFLLTPYDGLTQRAFTLRLSVLTGEDKPALLLRWVCEEQQREEIAMEFKGALTRELGGVATLTLGTFNPGN